MRYGVNGSTILGLHHSNDNAIECEKRAEKTIVQKPGTLMWVMNLLLPLLSLTLPSYITPPQYALYWSHSSRQTYTQKKN
jgi:hypothetical protein